MYFQSSSAWFCYMPEFELNSALLIYMIGAISINQQGNSIKKESKEEISKKRRKIHPQRLYTNKALILTRSLV